MLRTVILLTCFASALGANLDRFPSGRIVGGEDANIEDIPYQISLLRNGSHICGGSIVNSDTILTAAHCIQWTLPSHLQIRAGSSSKTNGGILVDVSKIVIHEGWNSMTINYDIGFLKLAKPLIFGAGIQPIRLPEQNESVENGADSLVSGWGRLWEGGPTPDRLQKITIPVVDQELCRSIYARHGITITGVMICAGLEEGGRSACQMDSGGPMVVDNTLVGVVSFGEGCGRPNTPGVYARVAAIRDWFDELSQ